MSEGGTPSPEPEATESPAQRGLPTYAWAGALILLTLVLLVIYGR